MNLFIIKKYIMEKDSMRLGNLNGSKLTQNRAVTAGHIRRYIAELLLRVIIPEDESILAEFFLGLTIHAGIIKIALLRIGEETLRLRASELCLAQGR